MRVVFLLALAVGGTAALATQGCDRGQEARNAAAPTQASPHPFETRYRSAECAADPYCRQLKRIWEEGGASEDAIRQNMRAANRTVTFGQLEQNAAQYEGTPWAFEGKIVDIVAHETRGFADYIVADVVVNDDPGKQVSVRGDFKTDVRENDRVYVVGYLTGTSRPRPGNPPPEYRDRKVVGMSARAMLRPGEAEKYRSG